MVYTDNPTGMSNSTSTMRRSTKLYLTTTTSPVRSSVTGNSKGSIIIRARTIYAISAMTAGILSSNPATFLVSYVILFLILGILLKFRFYFRRGAGFNPPTRLTPIPRPAPALADVPIEGENRSSTENVAAAITPIVITSSRANFFPGITKAATATIKPSAIYFNTRVVNSRISKF